MKDRTGCHDHWNKISHEAGRSRHRANLDGTLVEGNADAVVSQGGTALLGVDRVDLGCVTVARNLFLKAGVEGAFLVLEGVAAEGEATANSVGGRLGEGQVAIRTGIDCNDVNTLAAARGH